MRGLAGGGDHFAMSAFDQRANFPTAHDALRSSDVGSDSRGYAADREGHRGIGDDAMSLGVSYASVYSSAAAAAIGFPNGMGSSESTSTPTTDQYYQSSLSRHDP